MVEKGGLIAAFAASCESLDLDGNTSARIELKMKEHVECPCSDHPV